MLDPVLLQQISQGGICFFQADFPAQAGHGFFCAVGVVAVAESCGDKAAHGGQFEGLIEAADGSAAALVGLLSAQRFFRDVVPYRGLDVPFYKRSQLLASDLSLALGGSRLGRFDDLDRMTIFADNLVPHVLRRDGILDYAAPLAEAIERDELIRPGSEEEVEIRACAVDAVERIREAMEAVGRSASSRQLDQLLWHRGQAPAYKAAKRHRTQTVFY